MYVQIRLLSNEERLYCIVIIRVFVNSVLHSFVQSFGSQAVVSGIYPFV